MRMATVKRLKCSDLRTPTFRLQPEHLSSYVFEVMGSMSIE
jgi:hypothetical protein